MNDFQEQYKMLNDGQRKAVDTLEGPVIVIAGPGTGKTQILTLRIANILKQTGDDIGPENILALTFTNAGVVAMRERLATFVGAEEAYRTNIYSFHSFCEEQIGLHSDYFSSIIYSRVASDVEKIHIVEDILENNDFETLKTFASSFHYIRDILSAIDDLKREGVSPSDFVVKIKLQEEGILVDPDSYYKRNTKKNKKGDLKPDALKHVVKNRELQKVYELYQEKLKEKKLYDFTDMIMQFVEVAENNEELGSILREQYRYLLVDEHQDTNEGQNRIIDVIASSKHLGSDPNLFTVGDDKQAIYRFQGANVESFMNFGDKFENPVTINLENNYRSAQGILDHAHTLISAGKSKKNHTELTAFKKDEADVAVRHFKTYRDELVNLASDIKKRIESGIAPEDIAVFYRENNNLDFIKEVFEKEDLPFVVASKQNILDDAQIQKLLLLMSVVNDPMNNELMAKAILIDLVEIKSSDALLVLDKYKVLSRKMSLFELLKDKKQLKESRVKDIKSIEKFVSFLEKQIEKSHNTDFLEFFEQFVNESAFLEFILKRKDHIFLLKKLEKIYEEVKNAILEKKNYTLGDFVANIDTFYQYNLSMNVTRSVEARGVNLMSAHGSKGLEFEHVYITNAVNGLWGGKRSINKFKLPIDVAVGDMEDERRLFYVAITRAKQSLVISYADFDVNGKEKLSSLFISDINARLIDIEQDSVASTKVFFAPRIKDVSSLVSLEYIRDKFLETPISASSLNNYFESPLLYFFRNIVRLPSVPNKILLNGTVMHSALENYFKLSSEANKVLPKKVLLESLGDALETMQVPADYFGEIEKKGTEMLSGYWDFYKDDFNIDVAVEKKIKAVPFKLDGGEEILLTGAIDKMELLGEGTVSVVDYKTGKAWSQLAKDKKDSLGRQVMFYKLLLNLYNGGEFKMTEGTLDFIEPNSKTGQYEREVISVDDESAEKLKKDINVFAKDILSGEFLEREINKKFGNKSLDEYIRLLKILKND